VLQSNSSVEAHFPIAFAQIVYRDYLQVERQTALYLQKQNHFCFTLDTKASPVFKKRIHQLASCYPDQIHLAEREWDVRSSGKNQSRAYLQCLRRLEPYEWRYVVQLQNHDVPLRTNAELVEVFRIMNGTNDVGADEPVNHRSSMPGNYSFGHLNLFKWVGGGVYGLL